MALILDIYARVSRLGDDRQRSTGGQVEDCEARIEERGAQVGEVHIDSGRSAWNPRVKRPDWERLMSRLEVGATGGVIVFDMARFSRRPIEGERLILAADRGSCRTRQRGRVRPDDGQRPQDIPRSTQCRRV